MFQYETKSYFYKYFSIYCIFVIFGTIYIFVILFKILGIFHIIPNIIELVSKIWGKTWQLDLPLHIYGLFGPNCIFTVRGDIFVNKWTSLNGLFPRDNDETNLALFNSLLIDARFLLSAPRLHGVYETSACGEMEERRISMPPSF